MSIYVKDLAAFLGEDYIGPNVMVRQVCSLDALSEHGLSFIDNPLYADEPDINTLFIVNAFKQSFKPSNAYIKVKNPRKAYADLVAHFFCPKKPATIQSTAIIGNEVSLGESCDIGHHVVIEDNVTIGNACVIQENVVIKAGVTIGDNCFISPGVVIGGEGFGVVFDENIPVRMMPHLGSVTIGDDVFIGANSTVQKGTIKNTVIGNKVRISQNVSVGHNCRVDDNVLLAGSSHLSGSVVISRDVFVGSGVTIKDNVKIGKEARIGSGAVIQASIADGAIVFPAEVTIASELT